ncbi:prenyltransferase [Bacteroides uniformis]|nr:prenyltransferase [Bacteroides uniformis]
MLSSIPRCSPIGAGATYLVLVFFGFVPVCGTYYVQAYTLNMDVVVLSLVSGLAIDTLLMVNNYRDREQDAVSGKCTLVVRYGKKFGENMYLARASPPCCSASGLSTRAS